MMQKRSDVLVAVIFFLLVGCSSLFAAEEIQLRMAIRPLERANRSTKLDRDDLILTINGAERGVAALVKKERSLGRPPDLGRNFILSFHVTEYGSQVEKAVSYFIADILRPSDSLLLVTPMKIYQISVSPNKEKIVRDLAALLQRDCLASKKKRTRAEKNLRNKINIVKRTLAEAADNTTVRSGSGSAADSSQYGVRQILALKQFLDTFPQEFVNFRDVFLVMMGIPRYEKIIDLLGTREGERWWLHFHQDESHALLATIQEMVGQLSDYIDTREPQQSKMLIHLEKVLELSDCIPAEELLHTFVGADINYSLLAVAGIKMAEQDKGHADTSDLGRILGKIAEDSGGQMVNAAKLEQGLREMAEHKDEYYELIFNFDGTIEDKKISLAAKNSGTRLLYKKEFGREELAALVHYLSHEKVRIDHFFSQKNRITFTIKSFKHHEKGKFAILKVCIQLHDRQDVAVYQAENTLRSLKDEISLAIPLPAKYRGSYKLTITATDLLANSRATLECPIKL